jgi:hypothetical protein
MLDPTSNGALTPCSSTEEAAFHGSPRLWLRRGRYTPCMRKLDRLPWIDGFAWTSHGARIGVRVNDPLLLQQLHERLPPWARIGKDGVVDRMLSLWSPDSSVFRAARQYHVLYADHARVGRARDREEILDLYDSHVRLATAQYARPNLFVHAGAIGWKGKGLILPAPSLSGKSHLVAELVRAGAEYYSDDYAVLDGDGMLHAFPKPISLRAHKTARQRDVPAEELGGLVATAPIPVAVAAFCEFEDGAGWRPRRLSPAQAMLRLLNNTFPARERPREALDILQRVASNALLFECKRGDAGEIAGALLATAENHGGLDRWT